MNWCNQVTLHFAGLASNKFNEKPKSLNLLLTKFMHLIRYEKEHPLENRIIPDKAQHTKKSVHIKDLQYICYGIFVNSNRSIHTLRCIWIIHSLIV